MNRKNHAGFTIIELMLTIAIAAVLLAVAVPSYTNMVLNNCLTTKTNQLVSAMQLARSTAVTFRDEVTVGSISCQLDEDNNNAADGSCATSERQNNEFGEGVVVYRDLDGDGFADLEADEDADGDGVLDPGEDLNGNGVLDDDVPEIIRRFNFNCAATMNSTINGTAVAATAAIVYQSNGAADGGATIEVCDSRDSASYDGKLITLTTTGRPTTDTAHTCP